MSQRKKRNTLVSDSQTISLGPDVTSYTYNASCPYSDSLTLCPYSQYCFSVVSVFEFRGTPIDVSDSTLTTMCTNTSEDGEFTIFETVLYFNVGWLAPSDPPQELNVTNIGIREIDIRWKFPQFPNGVIIGFTVSTATLYVTIL